MKNIIMAALISSTLYTGAAASSFDIGLSGDDRGITGFSLSIGDYYRVPYREVIMVQRSIPREEMSVVYLLSRHSHHDAQFIVDLRLRGYSWWDITTRIGLDPRTLYIVDSNRYHRPPYGKAYGYRTNRLNDDEIIDLSNVIFLSRYHGVSPDDIISRRYKGERYISIDSYYRTRHTENQQFDHRYDRTTTKRYEKNHDYRDREKYDDHREKVHNRVFQPHDDTKRNPHAR